MKFLSSFSSFSQHSLLWFLLILWIGFQGSSLEERKSLPKTPHKIPLNTASKERLQLVPGISKQRANWIISERKRRGSFKHLDELAEIKGIGRSLLKKISPYLRIP